MKNIFLVILIFVIVYKAEAQCTSIANNRVDLEAVSVSPTNWNLTIGQKTQIEILINANSSTSAHIPSGDVWLTVAIPDYLKFSSPLNFTSTQNGPTQNGVSGIFAVHPSSNANTLKIRNISNFPIGGNSIAFDVEAIAVGGSDGNIVLNSTIGALSKCGDILGTNQTVFSRVDVLAPLPLNLIKFEAKQVVDVVNLNWKTANEKGFSHFELQRSADGKEFGTIATVQANETSYYNYADGNPTLGVNYYRLNMIDLDGSQNFSKTISLNFDKNSSFAQVENPGSNGIIKVFTNLKSPKFTLFNALGSEVSITENETIPNNYYLRVNTTPGIYFLNIASETNLITRKVLIK